MNIVVLCPGPSLAALPELPSCSLSIAVNRAAMRFACDWWAALDAPLIAAIDDLIIGSPKLFTRRENRQCGSLTFEDVYPFRNPAESYYTTPAAMALAAHLGATQIDLYGCDWAADRPDFDGSLPAESDRSAGRFAREQQHFDQVNHWLQGRGIEVTRHGLNG